MRSAGIKQADGYAREVFRLDPEFAVRVAPGLCDRGVLLEPASVVAKACTHAVRILHFGPNRAGLASTGGRDGRVWA
jgi:hypothetical protein